MKAYEEVIEKPITVSQFWGMFELCFLEYFGNVIWLSYLGAIGQIVTEFDTNDDNESWNVSANFNSKKQWATGFIMK